MIETVPSGIPLQKLAQLRAELVELAFPLDRRGRPEGADVAMMIFARVGELCEEHDNDQSTYSGG